jgi:DNA polymerase-3 subunit gamma/tau
MSIKKIKSQGFNLRHSFARVKIPFVEPGRLALSELFALSESREDATGMDALFPGMDAPRAEAAPAYRVLARKYRPSTFDELIGQEAMVKTLTNAIATGRLPHAWMLTGVRGIGKTTTARVIARALNCTGPDGTSGPTINPCGVCDACRMIAEDRHVDVMEMDAASRTGVDDIREIVDGVRYGPVSARYKIYILDEVHMLSKQAFNALLKTLEEPPPHTKFIFATTEIRKVPVTVLSRCQRFDLRRIDSEMLAKHFTRIVGLEQATAEDEAIKLIAHAADGSVRDGLSLLDQAIARGNGAVTLEEVKDMLGLADRGQSLNLCKQLLRGQMADALQTFAMMQQAGSDPLQVLQDLCEVVHLLTRGQVIADFASSADVPEYDRVLLREMADIKIPALARAWQILLKGITEVQGAPHPANAAEMALIRLAYAAELPPPGELVRQLRDQVASGAVMPAADSGGGSGGGAKARLVSNGGVVAAVATGATETVAAAALPMPADFRAVVALFAANREGALHAELYNNVRLVRCEPGKLEIQVIAANPAAGAPNLAGRLGQCLTTWTGQRWMVSIGSAAGQPTLAEQDRAAEKARQDKAIAHPLTQAMLAHFPEARLIGLRQKAEAPVIDSGGSDDAPSLDVPAED